MGQRGRHVSSNHTGTVQFYNRDQGYGFVSTDFEDADDDIFFHISEVPREDVHEGDEFEYAVYESDEGYQACLIQVVGEVESYSSSRSHDQSHTNHLPRDSQGKVSFYNDKDGYGFIEGVSGVDDDVFIHISDAGTVSLKPGDKVEFNLNEGREGPQALNLTVTSRASRNSSSTKTSSSSRRKEKQRQRMAGNAEMPEELDQARRAPRAKKSSTESSSDPENKNKLLKGNQ